MHLCIVVRNCYIKTVQNLWIHASIKELKSVPAKDPTVTHAQFAALYTHKAYELIFDQINKFEDGTFFIERIVDSFVQWNL